MNQEALVKLAGKRGLESQPLRGCLEKGSTAQEVEQNTLCARGSAFGERPPWWCKVKPTPTPTGTPSKA